MLAQEVEVMKTWTQALENRESENVDNVDEDVEAEDKVLELPRERAETTEYPTQDFFTTSEGQKKIAAEMEKSKFH